jgi:hypothetical protein
VQVVVVGVQMVELLVQKLMVKVDLEVGPPVYLGIMYHQIPELQILVVEEAEIILVHQSQMVPEEMVVLA